TRSAPSHPPGPIKIILESGGHLLCHPGLLAALGYLRQDQLQWRGYRGTASHSRGCTRPAGSDQLSSASRRRALGVPIANENRLVLIVTHTLIASVTLYAGGSHNAWLWPLAKTRRKAARAAPNERLFASSGSGGRFRGAGGGLPSVSRWPGS